MSILVIAESDNLDLKNSSYSVLAAANQIKSLNNNLNIDVLLLDYINLDNNSNFLEKIKKLNLINKLLLLDIKHGLAEPCADLIKELAQNYEYILFAADTYGKNIAPRVASYLNINPINDVIEIVDTNIIKRFIYAGNAVAKVKVKDKIKLYTIRPTCFDLDLNNNANNIDPKDIKIEYLSYDLHQDIANLSKYLTDKFSEEEENLDHKHKHKHRPELTSAKIIVSGGRALKSKENFELIKNLADKLNAAVGASRAAVDAGYVPNDYQVGQTGKVVAPDLYIAIGISGAIQHLAGIQDSKIIVAINKDKDAPIFSVADYGLVGDLFEVVPKLIELI